MTEKNYRKLKRAIHIALKNGWEAEHWPLNDLPFELDCCATAGDILADKGFRNTLGEQEWINLVDRMLDSKRHI